MTVTAENFAGFLLFVLLAAVPVAFVLGLVIRWRYRKAVARAMMGTTSVPAEAFPVPQASFPNGRALSFDVRPLARAAPLRPGLGGRYLLSALAYAAVMVTVMFWLNGLDFLPLRFALVCGAIAFPGLMMAGYVAGLRWYAVLGLALVWCALMLVAFRDSALLLLLFAGPAMVFALIVGNPGLRTTAVPLFMVAVILVTPLVFSLELAYALVAWGALDGLRAILPDTAILPLYILSAAAIILIVGAGAALLSVRLFARLSSANSEFTMQNDLLWACHSFWMVSLGWNESAGLSLLYLLGFPAYRLSLRAQRPRGKATEMTLLLRVFGQRKSQTRLARSTLMERRTRGPVLLIGGEDLATETLDPPELAAFLSGRLRDIFIETPQDLSRVASAGDTRLSDGLFPMVDHYCRNNSWQATVLTLMTQAHTVVIDMRGFDPDRAGIQFEINALAQRVPAGHIRVIASSDATEQIKSVFAQAWAALPNTGAQGTLQIRTI